MLYCAGLISIFGSAGLPANCGGLITSLWQHDDSVVHVLGGCAQFKVLGNVDFIDLFSLFSTFGKVFLLRALPERGRVRDK